MLASRDGSTDCAGCCTCTGRTIGREVCDGALLYPNPDQTAGYVSCDVDATGPTYAADGMVSGADGDPRLTFDGAHHQVLVGDGGNESVRDYLATITLDGPRPFRRL